MLKVMGFIKGVRRYSVSIAGLLYIVLQTIGSEVSEEVVKEAVSAGFLAWDTVLAAYAAMMSLWSALRPAPAVGTKG